MDMEEFCDNHCPMSTKLVCRDNSIEIDCDLEESECPFKDVDMGKVILNPLNSPEPPEKVISNPFPKFVRLNVISDEWLAWNRAKYELQQAGWRPPEEKK